LAGEIAADPRWWQKNMQKVLCFFFIYAVLLYLFRFRLPVTVMAFFVLITGGYTFFVSRSKKPFYLLGITILPVALLFTINLSVFKLYGEINTDYNQKQRLKELYVPMAVFIISYFPVLAAALLAVIYEKSLKIKFFVLFILIISLAFIYNNFCGYNNHPYRFISYAALFLAVTAACGIKAVSETDRLHSFSKLVILTAFLILLGYGLKTNISMYTNYAFRTTKKITPRVKTVSAAVNALYKANPEAVFYIDPGLRIGSLRLAPYTAAKFFDISILALKPRKYSPHIRKIHHLLQNRGFKPAVNYIKNNKLTVDYFVLPSRLRFTGIKPVRQNKRMRYAVYEVGK
ncbi:MAG TPA: hypothetical protein VKS21_03365, partial [Spirochaetota bacterium]|nr:hypothetical protein [Spirochaetota bacterium]